MALPLPPGLTPAETGFLCEMELVTVIPRQRLESLELMGGPTQPLNPPFPTPLPLWLALLLKKQRRANIQPPAWLTLSSLRTILDFETDDRTAAVFSPPPALPHPTTVPDPDLSYLSPDTVELSTPFLKDTHTTSAQEGALPYHWLELASLLLASAADDFPDADAIRILIRDLREVRMSKLRKGFKVLEGGAGLKINGVGGLEVAEVRGFVGGVVDGLRRLGRAREEMRREREEEGGETGAGDEEGSEDGMGL
nr:hypothetical protein B0A51_13759 [Rachicladosporium sp. CCFEE 5018]